MCPPPEGTTAALQQPTVAVRLVVHHRRLKQRVSGDRVTEVKEEGYVPTRARNAGDTQSRGYPATSARHRPQCARTNDSYAP